MSNNRIVGPDGLFPAQDGKPPRPPTTQERLALALLLWQQGKKAEAFVTSLNAIAFLSAGLAAIGKNFLIVEQREEALKKEIEELKANVQTLSTALATVNQRLDAIEKARAA